MENNEDIHVGSIGSKGLVNVNTNGDYLEIISSSPIISRVIVHKDQLDSLIKNLELTKNNMMRTNKLNSS